MSKRAKIIAKIKEYIRSQVVRELEEASTTYSAGVAPGGPGHYFTPYAFRSKRKKDKEKLKKITRAGGYKPVNEDYSGMFLDVIKTIKVNRPDELNAIRDLADEYEIGRVLYMARTNPKGLKKAVDDRVKEKKQFIKGKNLKELKEKLSVDPRKVYGGTGAKQGMVLTAQKGLKKILDLSKKNPSNVFLVSDDNYTNFGPYYVKNGKVAKYTVANPNYDLQKNKVRSLKVPSDVILKFTINEGRYHDWRNDESLTPKQKIGKSMREIRDALNELDKTVKMNLKLKTELKMKSEDYWKNTHKALTKISERLVKMANKVGNLK